MPGKIFYNSFLFKKSVHQSDTTVRDTIPADTSRVNQDTSRTPDTTGQEFQILQQPDTGMDLETIDSLFRANEQKEKEFEQAQKSIPLTRPKPKKEATDTLSDLYEIFGVTQLPIADRLEKDPGTVNFLYNIPAVKPDREINAQEQVMQTRTEQPATEPKMLRQERKLQAENGFDWMLYFLIGIFLLIGWTRLFYKKYFDNLMKGIFFFNYAQSLFYEKSSLTTRAAMLLNFSYFLTMGAFLFQVKEFLNIPIPYEMPEIFHFLLFSAFFVVWYLWNALFTTFIGSVFQRGQTFSLYFHNYNLYRKLHGIVLFPVVLVIQFIAYELKDPLFLAGAILFGTIYFMHIIRGLQLFLRNNVSIFYLILYLCALEILPLFVLFEAIRANF